MIRIVNNQNKKDTRRELRKNQTPQESLLWAKIRNNQLGYKWKRQVSIGFYIADFYCSEKLLAVEIDGSQHLDNQEYDNEREQFFKSYGIKTLRFWNNEINTNLDGVIVRILHELEHTSPQPSPGKERAKSSRVW